MHSLMNRSLKVRVVKIRCCENTTSSGFMHNSQTRPTATGMNMINKNPSVQNQGADEMIQPKISKKRNDKGTRLRRRLSNIFHLDSNERPFLCNFLSDPFTKGNIHVAICQSPLTQRWRRFISTRYCNGYCSYNCTSVI